ncbi:MAG: hypothetical protein U0744_10725 [Gemmataceae bacterium]
MSDAIQSTPPSPAPEGPRPIYCPRCDEPNDPRNRECVRCRLPLHERGPRRRDDSGGDSSLQALIPVNVSPWAVAAFFTGLIGCIPLLGMPFALAAIICGILGLVKRPANASTYGGATSNVRAVLGIVFGTLGLIVSGFGLVMIFLGK